MDDTVQDAVANVATQVVQSNQATQVTDATQMGSTPSQSATIAVSESRPPRMSPRKTRINPPTMEGSIVRAIQGGGSLTSPNPSISGIRADIRNALKFDPSNANLIEAQRDFDTAIGSADPAARAEAIAATGRALQAALGSVRGSSIPAGSLIGNAAPVTALQSASKRSSGSLTSSSSAPMSAPQSGNPAPTQQRAGKATGRDSLLAPRRKLTI
jgi:hypothetical protein